MLWYGDVPYAKLPGCFHASRSEECIQVGREWCKSHGFKGAGIIQEFTAEVAGLACIDTPFYEEIPGTTILGEGPGCLSATSLATIQDYECQDAARKVCWKRGYVGGIIDHATIGFPIGFYFLGCMSDAVLAKASIL